MTKAEVQEYVKKTMEASSCSQEAKDACATYLASVGTDNEKLEAQALICELKEDVGDIDSCISFYESDTAKQIFGDQLPAALEGAKKAKAAGEKYCVCPACQAGSKVIEHADVLLA